MKTNSLDFDAQALREKILDLAMRGKLVKQDPNDEPASVLLEKIKAEKAELVKEKTIKKTKPLPEITDEEKPFDIPDSWEWVRLGDVIELVSGRDVPKKYHLTNATKNSMPYITGASNIDKFGNINTTEWIENASVVVSKGTLLVSVKGTIGKLAILNIPQAHIARQIMGIENIYHLNSGYQRYFVEGYIQELQRKAKSMIPGVSRNDLLLAPFPLPPLLEQSRIAAKVAQLFALLCKVESSNQQYAKLQTLLKSKVLDLAMRGKLVKQDPNDEPASVLLEKIKVEKAELVKEKKIKKSKPLPEITEDEKPFDIPDSWEWVRLGEVTNFVGTGMVIPANKQFDTFTSQMVPYFKMNNIGNWNGEFGVNNWTYVLKTQNSDNYLLKSGQLLFNTRNSRELVGKTTIVPDNLNRKIVANNNILRIESFGKMKLKYISYYLISPFSRHMFLSMTAATTNVAAIYQKQLNKLLVPLPPLLEQSRIAAKIASLLKLMF